MFREGHCRHLQAAPSPCMSMVGAVLMSPCGTSSVLKFAAPAWEI